LGSAVLQLFQGDGWTLTQYCIYFEGNWTNQDAPRYYTNGTNAEQGIVLYSRPSLTHSLAGT
jgi:hypothetical protein